jgi:hypothetical protein
VNSDENEDSEEEWLGDVASLFSLFGVSMPKGEK